MSRDLTLSTTFPERPRPLNLPLSFSERRVILLALDVIALSMALMLTLALRRVDTLGWKMMSAHPIWFVVLIGIWLPLAYALDAYDLRTARQWSVAAVPLIRATFVTVVIYLLFPYLTPTLPSARHTLVAFPILTITLLLMGRGLYLFLLTQQLFYRRAAILGAGYTADSIARCLAKYGDGMYELIGFVDEGPVRSETRRSVDTRNAPVPESSTDGPALAVLGDRHGLLEIITRRRVNTLILALTHEGDGQLLQILMDCLERGVEILPMPVLYEQLTGRVPIEHVGDNWYVGMPLHHPGTKGLYPLMKRLMDISVGCIGLLFVAMLIPVVSLAIHLDSPGPVFYSQWRVGKGGRPFKVFKLRSMVSDAENGYPLWAKKADPRVTRVGRFLRATHLDEFPQFLNVVKGEMSLVGPRPERPEFVDELSKQIPFYRVRLAVKPGMAGWALVKQGYSASAIEAIPKLQYDLYWIKHQSLWLDLVILLKTVGNALAFGGR